MKWVDVQKLYLEAKEANDYALAHHEILESLKIEEKIKQIDFYELGEFYENWGKIFWQQGDKAKAKERWKIARDHYVTSGRYATGSGEGLAAMSAEARVDKLIKGVFVKKS